MIKDNNDGITVIDITTPEKPSYCFVSIHGLEAAGDAAMRVPLSATDYARAYYPVLDAENLTDDSPRPLEKTILRTIASLDGVPLVTLEMLADAWPAEYTQSQGVVQEGQLKKSSSVDESNMCIPSLSALALKPAVEHALHVEGTKEIEELVWMPGKA